MSSQRWLSRSFCRAKARQREQRNLAPDDLTERPERVEEILRAEIGVEVLWVQKRAAVSESRDQRVKAEQRDAPCRTSCRDRSVHLRSSSQDLGRAQAGPAGQVRTC